MSVEGGGSARSFAVVDRSKSCCTGDGGTLAPDCWCSDYCSNELPSPTNTTALLVDDVALSRTGYKAMLVVPGEMDTSVVSNEVRFASVKAVTALKTLCITREGYERAFGNLKGAFGQNGSSSGAEAAPPAASEEGGEVPKGDI